MWIVGLHSNFYGIIIVAYVMDLLVGIDLWSNKWLLHFESQYFWWALVMISCLQTWWWKEKIYRYSGYLIYEISVIEYMIWKLGIHRNSGRNTFHSKHPTHDTLWHPLNTLTIRHVISVKIYRVIMGKKKSVSIQVIMNFPIPALIQNPNCTASS